MSDHYVWPICLVIFDHDPQCRGKTLALSDLQAEIGLPIRLAHAPPRFKKECSGTPEKGRVTDTGQAGKKRV